MKVTRTLFRGLVLLAGALACSSCAVVSVTSDPAGAEIVYSRTGTGPWQPWPPESGQPAQTPATRSVRADPFYFIRVQKEGYHPVTPVFVDAGPMKRQHVHFQLEPTRQMFEAMQRERGLVLFQGEWVDPKEKGLVEYQGRWMLPAEKTALEQKAKGLVFYEPEGRWMLPAEIEAIEARRMTAQGLIRFKDQWMTPLEADMQKLIDRQVAKAVESSPTAELRIERIGPVFTANAELRLTDLAGKPLEVLLSGPQSRILRVPAYNSLSTQTLPGQYVVAVREAEPPGRFLAIGKVRLEAKNRYSTTYRGATAVKKSIPPALPALEGRKNE
ncbi:MAG: hypothetical protein N3D11_08200 [Candidatus Sumerlaeia bacterium]|nr:hypothetical protein [Candidatus Sumerlaeia bacterium]